MISGNRKEFVPFSQKVGFFSGKILAINPSIDQMGEFQDTSNLKEPEYNKPYVDKQTQDEHKSARIVFFDQAHDGSIFSKGFSIIDQVRASKGETNDQGEVVRSSKIQFINEVGNLTWAVDAEALKNQKYAWFTKREFRPALIGEERLYEFLQKWLSLEWSNPNTSLTLDNKKLFNGNFKELQDLLKIEQFKNASIVGYATIGMKIPAPTEEDPEPAVKYYQNVWDKILPQSAWQFIHPEDKTPALLENAAKIDILLGDRVLPNWIQAYIDDMSKEQFGCKEYMGKRRENGKLIVEELRDFDRSEYTIATGSSLHTEASNSLVPSGQSLDSDLPF